MVQVFLNDVLIAEGDNLPVVEGNYYFPPDAIKKEYFDDSSDTHTVCGWKGTASYYNLKVGETTVTDAAWYYPTPKDAAQNIKDHIAFYKNKVVIRE